MRVRWGCRRIVSISVAINVVLRPIASRCGGTRRRPCPSAKRSLNSVVVAIAGRGNCCQSCCCCCCAQSRLVCCCSTPSSIAASSCYCSRTTDVSEKKKKKRSQAEGNCLSVPRQKKKRKRKKGIAVETIFPRWYKGINLTSILFKKKLAKKLAQNSSHLRCNSADMRTRTNFQPVSLTTASQVSSTCLKSILRTKPSHVLGDCLSANNNNRKITRWLGRHELRRSLSRHFASSKCSVTTLLYPCLRHAQLWRTGR